MDASPFRLCVHHVVLLVMWAIVHIFPISAVCGVVLREEEDVDGDASSACMFSVVYSSVRVQAAV